MSFLLPLRRRHASSPCRSTEWQPGLRYMAVALTDPLPSPAPPTESLVRHAHAVSRQHQHRSRRDAANIPLGCDRREHYINIDDAGWAAWIQSPGRYDAGDCLGQCKNLPGGASCNATQLGWEPAVTYTSDSKLLLNEHALPSVKKCGCSY